MKYAPYSFSKIHTFLDCQKKFEYTYVNKIPIDRDYVDPSYFKRGRFLHAYIAERLNGGDGTKMKNYDVMVDDKLNLVQCADITLENEFVSLSYDFDTNKIESYIALNKYLEPNTKKSNTAIGGYVDYYAVQDDYAMIIDWKTGKYKESQHYSQLELYAIWLFQKFPEVNEIDLVFYYVEHNKFNIKTITPNDVMDLKIGLAEQIDLIEETNEFHTNETKQCASCKFFNTCMETYGIGNLNHD